MVREMVRVIETDFLSFAPQLVRGPFCKRSAVRLASVLARMHSFIGLS